MAGFLRVNRGRYYWPAIKNFNKTISVAYMIQKNSKFADDDKLKGALNMLEVRAALQRDHRWLEEQVNRNLMKFHENKCKDQHLGLNILLNNCMILRYFLYNLFTMQLSFLGFLAFSSAVSHNCQIPYGVCRPLI